MKKKILFTAAILAVGGLFFTSCDSDDDKDTTKPVIENIEPENGDYLQIGEHVHFAAEISDNESLRSYKIDIHSNFDGHTHKALAESSDSVAFSFSKSWTTTETGGESLLGKKNAHLHHHEIEIPKNNAEGRPYKTGNYHFSLFVVDEAGNESVIYRDVKLTYEEVADHDEE